MRQLAQPLLVQARPVAACQVVLALQFWRHEAATCHPKADAVAGSAQIKQVAFLEKTNSLQSTETKTNTHTHYTNIKLVDCSLSPISSTKRENSFDSF